MEEIAGETRGGTARDAPRVTVVIPTRDRWSLLPGALESALSQRGVAVDVVVADDGSTTAPPAEVRRPGVEVVRLETSGGIAAARNAAIVRATGEWVAFLDDDDIWAPDKLRLQIDAALGAGAPWAYATAVMVGSDGTAQYLWPLPDPERLLELLPRSNVIPAGSSNVVVAAETLDAVGGFDESFSRIADWDLWIRLAAVATPAAVPEPLVGYRQHTANMSGGGRRALLAEFRRLEAKHRALAVRSGVAFDRRGLVDWAERERRRGVAARASQELRSGRRLRAARIRLAAGVAHRDASELRQGLVLATDRLRGRGPSGQSRTETRSVEQPPWLRAHGPATGKTGA